MTQPTSSEITTAIYVRRDALLHLAFGLLGLLILVIVLPGIGGAWLAFVENYAAEPVLLTAAVLLFLTASLHSEALPLRRFYRLLAAGLGCWLAADFIGFAIRSETPGLFDFVKDVLLLASSCIVVVAADLRPALDKDDRQALLSRLTAAGSVFVIAGVFCYTALVPALFDIASYRSPFLVYAVLDVYIAVRFALQGLLATHRGWSSLLLLVGAAYGLIAVADLMVVAFDENVIPYEPGRALNAAWFLFYAPLFLAARLHVDGPRPQQADSDGLVSFGPATVLVLSLPLLHLVGYGFGLFATDSLGARSAFVAVWTVLAVLGLVGQRALLTKRA